MSNRNIRSKCSVCEKWMRADNQARHMKIHRDLLSLPDEDIEKELKRRHEEKVEREQKRQKIFSIAENLGVSMPEELNEPQLDETLQQQLLNNKNLYLERIEIGEKVSNYLIDDAIPEESLSKDHKYALDLYRNQQVRLDINKVELRPWQKDAFQLFESPTERNIIWIYGSQGNIGKSWFQNYIEAYFGYQPESFQERLAH